MKFIRRLNLDRIYGGEIALMRQHFDTTLSRMFTQLFTDGVGPNAFWAIYSDIAGLVIDCADCKALLEAKGDWLPFSDTVDRITSASEVGMKMFGFALPMLRSLKVKRVMDNVLEPLQNKELSGSVVEQARAKVMDELSAVPGLQTLPSLRDVRLAYRGVVVVVSVQSITEELNIRLACLIKSRARELNILEPIFMEDALVARGRPLPTEKVCAGLIAESKLARATANQMLATETWSQGEAVKELLGRKLPTLLAIDRTFVIEHSFIIGMMGDAGEVRLMEELSLCLPDESRAMTLRASSSKIDELTKTDLFKFCSRSAQGGITASAGILSNMVLGFPPQFTLSCSLMMMRLRERLPFFVRCMVPGKGENEPEQELVGKAALDMKLAALRAKATEGVCVRLDVLEEFNVFAFLMNNDDQKFVQNLTQRAVGSNDATAKEGAPVSPPPAVKSKPKAAAKAAASKSDAKSAVMSLFKN